MALLFPRRVLPFHGNLHFRCSKCWQAITRKHNPSGAFFLLFLHSANSLEILAECICIDVQYANLYTRFQQIFTKVAKILRGHLNSANEWPQSTGKCIRIKYSILRDFSYFSALPSAFAFFPAGSFCFGNGLLAECGRIHSALSIPDTPHLHYHHHNVYIVAATKYFQTLILCCCCCSRSNA